MNGMLLNILIEEYKIWLEALFIRNIPGKIGVLLRSRYWKGKFKKSEKFYLDPGCIITSPGNITFGDELRVMRNCCFYAHNNGLIILGDHVGMNSNVQINAADSGKIIIGNNVAIGPNVVIRASNHCYAKKGIPYYLQGHSGGEINICDDVWIGANCVIVPGVTIHKGAVIGACAVVTKDIPEYALAGGVPAKVIKLNVRL